MAPGMYNICWATEDTAFVPYLANADSGGGQIYTMLNNGSNANAITFTSNQAATGTGAAMAMAATVGTRTLANRFPLLMVGLPW